MLLSPTKNNLTSLFKEVRGFKVSKRGWREGVGDQQHPKYSKKCPPELCSPAHNGAYCGVQNYSVSGLLFLNYLP